jgi:hypothetical protein
LAVGPKGNSSMIIFPRPVGGQWSFALPSAGVASTTSKRSPLLDPTGKNPAPPSPPLRADPASRYETQHYAQFSPAASRISH